jgi:hypothetical protein
MTQIKTRTAKSPSKSKVRIKKYVDSKKIDLVRLELNCLIKDAMTA